MTKAVTAEQGTVHGEQKQEQGKDNFWEEFFGKQQAAEQDRGHDQGLESMSRYHIDAKDPG